MIVCTLCMGNQHMNSQHVMSPVHKSNIAKLPEKWWLLREDEIAKILREPKIKKQKKSKNIYEVTPLR